MFVPQPGFVVPEPGGFVVEGRNPHMELPYYARFLVREYSKPLMKFSAKYNRCIKELSNSWQVVTVQSIVQKRLCDQDADQVIKAFEEYVDALLEHFDARILVKKKTHMRMELIANCKTLGLIKYKKKVALLDLLYSKEDAMYEEEMANADRCLIQDLYHFVRI